jgi:DNA-binding response OmpR family regulator
MITRHRVLIVDPDPASAGAEVALLSSLGHDARVAPDPIAALAATRAFDPELVIVDAEVPEEAVEELRHHARAALYVAGLIDQSRCTDDTHFDYLIPKPVHAHALRRLLWRVEVRRTSRGTH